MLLDVSSHDNPEAQYCHDGICYRTCPDTGGVLIPLGGKRRPGLFAIVDSEDVPRVLQHSWWATRTNPRNDRELLYVKTECKKKTIYLHRFILGVTDRRVHIDHINHNPLDCRRENMRCVTHQANIFNRRGNLNSSSRYKGVSWSKRAGRWVAFIKIDGRVRYIGSFNDELQAAHAYDEMARRYFGENAYLNFPENAS